MTSPQELRDIATTIALEAGELILARRKAGVEVADTKSTSVDVVTLADRECEEFVKMRILELRPDDGFYGEEGSDTSGTSGLTWVVDPIDGTVNYLYDIPAYAVSIAVVEGPANPASWTQLAGVVYNPSTRELFSAALGDGAYLAEGSHAPVKLTVNNETDIGHALVATGFGYDSAVRAEQAQQLLTVLPAVRDIRRAGACSLDMCYVAAGRHDAYFERGTNPWDHGAGGLIVREAGGVVSGLNGQAEGKEMLIAASPEIFIKLEKLLFR